MAKREEFSLTVQKQMESFVFHIAVSGLISILVTPYSSFLVVPTKMEEKTLLNGFMSPTWEMWVECWLPVLV